MMPVLDTLLQIEKETDSNLMQLALVDICGTNNSIYKFNLIEGSIQSGNFRSNNCLIDYLVNSP